MKIWTFFALASLCVFVLISEAEGKSHKSSDCIKDCGKCESECKKLSGQGFQCSVSKPRKPNDFCTCPGFGVIPLCKNGVGGQHGSTGTWTTILISVFMALFVYSAN